MILRAKSAHRPVTTSAGTFASVRWKYAKNIHHHKEEGPGGPSKILPRGYFLLFLLRISNSTQRFNLRRLNREPSSCSKNEPESIRAASTRRGLTPFSAKNSQNSASEYALPYRSTERRSPAAADLERKISNGKEVFPVEKLPPAIRFTLSSET